MFCVFEKTCVRIGGEMFSKIKVGMRALREIDKSYIVAVSCFCSNICINKSTLVSHFKEKQADSKLRVPVLKGLHI